MSTQVELLSPKPGDYLIFYIDTGKMRPQQSADYMERVKTTMGERLDDDGVKHIFLARPELGGTQAATMSIGEMRAIVEEHDKAKFIQSVEHTLAELEESRDDF